MQTKNLLTLSLAVVSAIITVVLAPVIRLGKSLPALGGEQSYTTLIQTNNFISSNEPLSSYHLLSYLLGHIIPQEIVGVILPRILGIILVLGLLWLTRDKEQIMKIWLLVLTLLSSGFILLFNSHTPITLIFVLFLLLIICFQAKSNWSFIVVALLAQYGAVEGLLALLLAHLHQQKVKHHGILIGLILLLNSLLLSSFRLNYDYASISADILLGTNIAVIMMMVVLALAGFKNTYLKKGLPLILCTLILAIFIDGMFLYAYAIMVYLAAKGMHKLLTRRWEFQELKTLTIIAIICSLLIASVQSTTILIEQQPDNDMVLLLASLPKESKVLTSPRAIPYLHAHSVRTACTPGCDNQTLSILQSRDLDDTINYIKQNSITHIGATAWMWTDLTWTEKGEGILFLLRNPEVFTPMQESPTMLVYKVSAS